jgi:hypothetical protein
MLNKKICLILVVFIWFWLILFINIYNELNEKNEIIIELKLNQINNDIKKSIHSGNSNRYLPGEYGKATNINVKSLNSEEKLKYDTGWKNYEFNQYLSDMISVHRNLPDIRDEKCKLIKWYAPLPQTSVIIIFYNEAFSVLLRNVHSILDRTNSEYLKEIILVDDLSDFSRYFFHYIFIYFCLILKHIYIYR